jgi:hypothetical protein
MSQPFVITQGQISPSAATVLTTNARLFDLTGCTVAFSMRAVGSSTLTVNHSPAVILGDPLNGSVRYDWILGDTATAGQFSGWWTVTLPNSKAEDSPEFEIEVTSHSPAGPYALVSLEEMLDHLRLKNQVRQVKENDEQEIRRLILAASNRFEEVTNHRITVEVGTTHTFRYDGDVVMDMAPYDLRSLTRVTIDTDVAPFILDPSQYRLEPRNRPHGFYTHIDLQPYMPGGGSGINFWSGGANGYVGVGSRAFGREVQVLGDWGWTTIPESVKHGVLVLAARGFNNPMGAQAIDTGNVRMQFTRGTASGAGKVVGDDLPDEVASAWRPFVRPAV